jgi:glutamate--cysteine ligase catalytic subunit
MCLYYSQLWRYGKGDASQEKYGTELLVVGCSTNSRDEQFQEENKDMDTLQKWLVDVECEGCRGLFYRSAPNVIVPDADWPRNGDIVVGSEVPDVPGWIRLQNGYYLPMHSDDNKIQFLHKVSTRTNPSNPEMKRIGSGTPLFRAADQGESNDIASLLTGKLSVAKQPPSDTTPASSSEATSAATEESPESVRAAIHMDAMAFGMGCCCLQITFQGKDIDESRFMYDQLAVLAPIMMALTASTPFLKGRIADTDARWGIISESVDDRTKAERGRPDPDAPHDVLAGRGQRRLYKPRYDCISTYIYQGAFFQGDEREGNKSGLTNRVLNTYNDIPVPIAEESYQMLREAGIDPALSQHVAHLFVRDPLVIFEGAVEEVDDATHTEHWESIQSTNWQSVRWKPPPPRNSPNDPHIGWRTEFRSMELQLTDFENAAFTAFTVLLTRVILTFDLNLYIPLSRVDSNMQRAHSRNAAAKGKFFFRRHMAPLEEGDDGYGVRYNSMFSRAVNGDASPANTTRGFDDVDADGVSRQRRTAPFAPGSNEENAYEEMSMAEIMLGKGDYFPGLIPLVQAYLDYINCDSITRNRLDTYLAFIEKRATGELVTPATWMRNYVRTHAAYKGDSVISDEIAYDLVKICSDIGLGKVHIPELLGDVVIDPITTEGAYEIKLDSRRAKNDHILGLLARYKTRDSFNSAPAEVR